MSVQVDKSSLLKDLNKSTEVYQTKLNILMDPQNDNIGRWRCHFISVVLAVTIIFFLKFSVLKTDFIIDIYFLTLPILFSLYIFLFTSYYNKAETTIASKFNSNIGDCVTQINEVSILSKDLLFDIPRIFKITLGNTFICSSLLVILFSFLDFTNFDYNFLIGKPEPIQGFVFLTIILLNYYLFYPLTTMLVDLNRAYKRFSLYSLIEINRKCIIELNKEDID